GANLGGSAGAHVFVGGAAAAVLPDALPDGALAVLVPELSAAGAPVDVAVTNSQGQSSLPGSFSYLGLGHPHSLTLRSIAHFTPVLNSGAILGDTAFLVDGKRHLLLTLDPANGSLSTSRAVRIP